MQPVHLPRQLTPYALTLRGICSGSETCREVSSILQPARQPRNTLSRSASNNRRIYRAESAIRNDLDCVPCNPRLRAPRDNNEIPSRASSERTFALHSSGHLPNSREFADYVVDRRPNTLHRQAIKPITAIPQITPLCQRPGQSSASRRSYAIMRAVVSRVLL